MGGKRNKRKRREERQKATEATENASNKRSRKSNNDDAIESESKPDMNKNKKSSCLIFQDVMKDFLDGGCKPKDGGGANEDDEEVSLKFFELANSPAVGFRISDDAKTSNVSSSSQCIVLKQDTDACGKHTGGIVWETAYLLLQYILSTKAKLGKMLEVGSGCGLVGQVIAAKKAADKIVMTEHADVIPNLKINVEKNRNILKQGAPLHVCNLDWEHCEEEVKQSQQMEPHSFDTILGTDVVFTPKLVEPLWKTLKYMSHPKTNIYLCLQERCAASHKLLMEKASDYNFHIEDISSQIDSLPSCRWGRALECRLFHVTVTQ